MRRCVAVAALAVALVLAVGPVALAYVPHVPDGGAGVWVPVVCREWQYRLVSVWRLGPGGWTAEARPVWDCRLVRVWRVALPGR